MRFPSGAPGGLPSRCFRSFNWLLTFSPVMAKSWTVLEMVRIPPPFEAGSIPPPPQHFLPSLPRESCSFNASPRVPAVYFPFCPKAVFPYGPVLGKNSVPHSTYPSILDAVSHKHLIRIPSYVSEPQRQVPYWDLSAAAP